MGKKNTRMFKKIYEKMILEVDDPKPLKNILNIGNGILYN